MKNLIGKRFGRLTIIGKGEPKVSPCGSRKTRYVCQCDCGIVKTIYASALTSGLTLSCGCYHRERTAEARSTHGRSKKRGELRGYDKLYNTWHLMIKRCHDENSSAYHNYGARGITVCDTWRNSVDAFIADMGDPPSPKHTIERVDNNGPYCKENCIWATRATQARNTRNAVKVTVNGSTIPLAELAEISGINYTTLWHRVKSGWKPEELTQKPLRLRRKYSA